MSLSRHNSYVKVLFGHFSNVLKDVKSRQVLLKVHTFLKRKSGIIVKSFSKLKAHPKPHENS